MLILANIILIYLVASLEDIFGFIKKAKLGKLTIQASISEQVKLYQYVEFSDLWKIVFYEAVRVALFVALVLSNNYLYFLAFIFGLALSIWVEDRGRPYLLFLLIYLLMNYFWVGILFVIIRVFLWYKRILPEYFDVLFLGGLSIIFWLINYELVLIGYLLTFLLYVLTRIILEWRKAY